MRASDARWAPLPALLLVIGAVGAAADARAGEGAQPAPPPQPEAAAPAEVLTLADAVTYALKNNPRAAEAAAQVRAAQARARQRQAERLPQLGVNNFVFRQGPVIPGFAPGSPPAVPPYRYNVGIFLSQVVFDWGQRTADERAARRAAESTRFQQGETENDVRLVVGVTYYNVLRAQALVAVARERLETAQEQHRVAKARFEADVSPRFDVLRTEAEMEAARQGVIEADNDVSLAQAALNTALGRTVTTSVALSPAVPPAAASAEIGFEQLREAALRRRPQLRALEMAVRSGQDSVRARRAERKPQVILGANYDRPNPGGFAPQSFRYSAGLVMTFPFFDSGLGLGRVREAEALTAVRRQELERFRQQLELELRQAQLDAREALQRAGVARKEQASAREALRVAEVRYRAGVGTNLEVTDAEVAVARAGQNLANAEYDYLTALIRLESAAGAPLAELTSAATPPAREP